MPLARRSSIHIDSGPFQLTFFDSAVQLFSAHVRMSSYCKNSRLSLFHLSAFYHLIQLASCLPECHQECTLIRSSLDPHSACKSSRRASDQTLGRACEFGFNNGYLKVCMAMCRFGISDDLASPAETCTRYPLEGSTKKARLACELGENTNFANRKYQSLVK